MSDPAGQVGLETPPETPPAPAGQPAPSIIGPDGKFGEAWRNGLPEDIRGEKSLETIKDISTLARSFVHAQRMVGKNKVVVPTETSTQAEIEEFWNAIGRPKTVADYLIVRPKDHPEEYWDQDFAKGAGELFFRSGLTKKQSDAVVQFYNQQVLQVIKEQEEAEVQEIQEGMDRLHDKWGAAYDQKIRLGNYAAEQGAGGDDALKQRLVEKFGNDPDFAEFAANLGEKFAEHGTTSPGAMASTPAQLEERISELMHTDAFMQGGHPEHKAMVDKVYKLRLQLTGGKMQGQA